MLHVAHLTGVFFREMAPLGGVYDKPLVLRAQRLAGQAVEGESVHLLSLAVDIRGISVADAQGLVDQLLHLENAQKAELDIKMHTIRPKFR